MTAIKFSEFVDESDAENAKINGVAQTVGELKPEWVFALQKFGFMPDTNEISIRDIDARHTLRPKKSRPLPKEWYKNLPHHLQHPDAVLLDITHPEGASLLLIFHGNNVVHKLVVRLNYTVRKQGVMNIVVSGQNVMLGGIKAMLGRGYELIEGTL
ncbi:MAG: hypothetical protein QM537_04970 [Candidatus Symbiobacter sp.]|nr:hypothetical protein [Candidatus Symbiobacter sp.]